MYLQASRVRFFFISFLTAVVGLSILLPLAVLAQAVTFSSATNFAVAANPISVVAGDFDGDNNLDLATANSSSEDVSVLLGDGAGSFGPVQNFPAGVRPWILATGDLDGDNDLDLAVPNSIGGDSISVFLGDGMGSFAAAQNFSVGSAPHAVAIGDFDGDNNLDLAASNYSDGNISILLGNGAGSFGTPTNFAVGASPVPIATDDLNGDSNLDLVVGNTGSNDISILLGDGLGSFSTSTNFAVGSFLDSISIGDLDGDSNLDLVVANQGSDTVSILLGDGNGSFGGATDFPAGSNPKSAVIGDLNGDSNPDLAVANVASGNVSILLGDGTGSFGAVTNFSVGSGPSYIATGDFDEDSYLDLAVANQSSNDVSILLNTTFAAPTTGTLIIQKIIVDSASTTNQFAFMVNGGPVTAFEADGENTLELPSGTYHVNERLQIGFIPSLSNCREVELEVGETETCVMTSTAVHPANLSGDTTGTVVVGETSTTSGQLEGDQSNLVWTIIGGTHVEPSTTFSYAIDNLKVVVNGSTLFENPFDVAPPAGPIGMAAGGSWSAAGGKAFMDENGAIQNFLNLGTIIIQETALFFTNFNVNFPGGLRRNNDFSTEARYDLVMPAAGGSYSMTLGDGSSPNLQNQNVSFVVARSLDDDVVRVRVVSDNFNTNERIVIAEEELVPAPGDDQIVFRYEHVAGTHEVSASYDLLDDGVVTDSIVMTPISDPAPVFDYYDVVRVAIAGLTPGTVDSQLAGTYGTLTLNETSGEWSYGLGATPAQQTEVDGLAEDSSVEDNFSVQARRHAGGPQALSSVSVTVEKPAAATTGTLIIQKIIVDSASTTNQFAFLVNGGPVTPFEADGENELTLDPGTYNIVERFQAGFLSEFDNCKAVVLDAGETETCTITNTAIQRPGFFFGDDSRTVVVGETETASGQFESDQDRTVWTIIGGASINPSASFSYAIDNLNAVVNGSTLLNLSFNDPPPAGGPPSMAVFGTWSALGSRGIVNEIGALLNFGVVPPPAPVVETTIGETATILTNFNASSPTGFRSNNDFSVDGRYDLIIPTNLGSSYFMILLDGGSPNLSNQQVVMVVTNVADGSGVKVRFQIENANLRERTVIWAEDLNPAPGDDQIEFHFNHVAGTHEITASYDLLDNGVVTHSSNMGGEVAPLFDYIDIARIVIGGLTPGTLQSQLAGIYGTMTIEQGTGEWTYELGTTPAQQAAIDALPEESSIDDIFNVQVRRTSSGPFHAELVDIIVEKPAGAPVITDEDTEPTEATEDSLTITWTTDHPATSRVVYDTVSHDPLTEGAPNYGYANSTVEDSNLVTEHSVTVTGLTPETNYYLRAVSHGSPEAVSNEIEAQTVPAVPNTPTNKDQCKKGGWQNYTDENGQLFPNQGQCVSWVNHNT